MILLRFGEHRCGSFLGIFQADWRTVWIRHLRQRPGERSHYEQSGNGNSHGSFLRHSFPSSNFEMKDIRLKMLSTHLLPGAQTKFAASFVSPLPLYFATCGYGHSGRVNFTPFVGLSSAYFVATIDEGAIPFSTHRSRASCILRCGSFAPAPSCPKEFAPGPPPQCCNPGTM